MDAHYTLSRVASAADTPTPVLSRYLEHGVIRLRHGDIDSSTPGIPRQFGVRRVLQVALTRTLNKLGVAPQRAADAALVWTDQGAPGVGPGEVFANGLTFLAIDDAGPRIVNVDADASAAEVMRTGAGWQPGASILIDLRRLRERVLERLADGTDEIPIPAHILRETK